MLSDRDLKILQADADRYRSQPTTSLYGSLAADYRKLTPRELVNRVREISTAATEKIRQQVDLSVRAYLLAGDAGFLLRELGAVTGQTYEEQ